MKILGIMGSPRIKGNTDLLLEAAFEGAKSQGAEVEKLIPDRLKFTGCREIYACLKDGECILRDDMTAVYPKLLNADRIIIASPIFFYGLTAQVKALIDRCQSLWENYYTLKRPPPDGNRKGAFISVATTKGERLFEGSILTVKYFFRAIGVKYSEELLIRGVDKKGEIKDHPTALKDAFELGKRLAS